MDADSDVESATSYAIPYQRMNDNRGPDVLVDLRPLSQFHLQPEFDGIALYSMASEAEDICKIASDANKTSCKGLVLTLASTSFPVTCSWSFEDVHVDIPILLVDKQYGGALMRELGNSSRRVLVKILKDSPSPENYVEHWSTQTSSTGDREMSSDIPHNGQRNETRTTGLKDAMERLLLNKDKRLIRLSLDIQKFEEAFRLCTNPFENVKLY